MGPLKVLSVFAQLFVLVGALNWGLVGYFGIDAVQVLLPKAYMRTAYITIGAAALFLVVSRIMALGMPLVFGKV